MNQKQKLHGVEQPNRKIHSCKLLAIIILSIVVICNFHFELVLLAVLLKPTIFSEKTQNHRNALKAQDLGLKSQVWEP